MGQNLNFPGLRPGSPWESSQHSYSAPPDPLADGRGLAAPTQEPHPRSRAFGPRFYGSQGLTHYRVANDRFEM